MLPPNPPAPFSPHFPLITRPYTPCFPCLFTHAHTPIICSHCTLPTSSLYAIATITPTCLQAAPITSGCGHRPWELQASSPQQIGRPPDRRQRTPCVTPLSARRNGTKAAWPARRGSARSPHCRRASDAAEPLGGAHGARFYAHDRRPDAIAHGTVSLSSQPSTEGKDLRATRRYHYLTKAPAGPTNIARKRPYHDHPLKYIPERQLQLPVSVKVNNDQGRCISYVECSKSTTRGEERDTRICEGFPSSPSVNNDGFPFTSTRDLSEAQPTLCHRALLRVGLSNSIRCRLEFSIFFSLYLRCI